MIVVRILGRLIRFHIKIMRRVIQLYMRTKSFPEAVRIATVQIFHTDPDVIRSSSYIDYIVMKDGNKYYTSKFIDSVRQVQTDYRFSDIRSSDIVVDIGACVGGFSIPASRKAKYVYAIEPIVPDLVEKNVLLNGRDNIGVLPIALGNGQKTQIEFAGYSKSIETKTLTQIKDVCGGCDFLKIDCEGCEWNIKLEELEGIRRIEMEVHKAGFPFSMMEDKLSKAGFTYEVEGRPDGHIGLWLIHGRSKEDSSFRIKSHMVD